MVRALKEAARELLQEKGSRFSVREVAERAGVNHGLIYRHFGSKEELITATVVEGAQSRLADLRAGRSPVDIYTRDTPESAAILAHLIMDGASDLITSHPVMDALVAMAAANHSSPGQPAPEMRAAVAGSLILGWSMFGEYLRDTARVDPTADPTAFVNHLVRALISGDCECLLAAAADPELAKVES